MFYLIDSANNFLSSSTDREDLQRTIDASPNAGWTIQEGNLDPIEGEWIWSNNTLVKRPDTEDEILFRRRDERKEIFKFTIDGMTNLWYDSLTQQQKTEIQTWRQAWLDYPATGVRPDDLPIFEGWDDGLNER